MPDNEDGPVLPPGGPAGAGVRLRLPGEQRLETAVMFLAPWLVCALLAWCMWWYWQRQKRK